MRLDYAAIRRQIPIRSVLDLIQYQPTCRRFPRWRGSCPICQPAGAAGRQRCFSVHLDRNLFHCFRCNRSGNMIDLWMYITRLTLYPATCDLCQRLGVPPVILTNTQPPSRP